MEIEGDDGTIATLNKGSENSFGRGLGFPSDDPTVSRRHVLFELQEDEEDHANPNSGIKVRFEVIGKNPIWVRDRRSGEIRVFKRYQRGELVNGDDFCVSAKTPAWFRLKRKGHEEDEEEKGDAVLGNQGMDAESEGLLSGDFESLDVSEIDPIKEFGFIVIGHEFDQYPKHMIRAINAWDWFLEEPKKTSSDDEVLERKRKSHARGKRKLDDDEDWTGESEDDKGDLEKLGRVSRPKYSTRSKNPKKTYKSSRTSAGKKTGSAHEDDSGEEDETLGDFIVNEDDLGEEGIGDDEDEIEEDFDDDDDEEDL